MKCAHERTFFDPELAAMRCIVCNALVAYGGSLPLSTERSEKLDEKVKIFSGVTRESFDPDIVLQGARRAELTSVLVLGWQEDGELFFSASDADGPEALWLLEMAKHRLLVAGSAEEDEP